MAKKARKNEIRGGRIFSNGNCANFQFYTDLKTEKWKDAKNAIERKENSRTRVGALRTGNWSWTSWTSRSKIAIFKGAKTLLKADYSELYTVISVSLIFFTP